MVTNESVIEEGAAQEPDDVRVCCGGDCMARNALQLLTVLEETYSNDPTVSVATRNCTGYCSIGPNVDVNGNVVHHNTPRTVCEHVEEARALPHNQGMVTDAAINHIIDREDLF